MRVACGLSTSPEEAIEFYELISSLDYLPSSPTLFNSGTTHPQMSSCYLLDSPEDNLDAIYDRYRDVARLSKHAGGIGLSYSRIRSRGSLIRGTNGLSNGIVPWLKTLDSSVAAVNQGGRRKGAACVYLETWHADIEAFLELQGEHRRRGAAHPQPEPGQLGPRPVHGARRAGLAVERCSTRRRCRTWSTCTATTSARPTWRPSPRASTRSRSRPASSTAA